MLGYVNYNAYYNKGTLQCVPKVIPTPSLNFPRINDVKS